MNCVRFLSKYLLISLIKFILFIETVLLFINSEVVDGMNFNNNDSNNNNNKIKKYCIDILN